MEKANLLLLLLFLTFNVSAHQGGESHDSV